jgi:hypothetical protein
MPKALRGIKEVIKHGNTTVLLFLSHLPKALWELLIFLEAACEVCSYLARQFYFDNF